jgi:hypothetical protein
LGTVGSSKIKLNLDKLKIKIAYIKEGISGILAIYKINFFTWVNSIKSMKKILKIINFYLKNN